MSEQAAATKVTAVPGNQEGDTDFIRGNRYRWSNGNFRSATQAVRTNLLRNASAGRDGGELSTMNVQH